MTSGGRRSFLATLLAGGAAAAWAQAAAPARGELVLDEPGQISAEPLFAAALSDLDHRAARPPHGRPLIVNFWARWCGPCKVEIPELVALHASQRDVEVVGIALENEGTAVRDFAKAYDMDYALLLARNGAGLDLMRLLGNPQAGLPFTLAIDRRGAVVARRLGVLTRAQLDLAVQRAMR